MVVPIIMTGHVFTNECHNFRRTWWWETPKHKRFRVYPEWPYGDRSLITDIGFMAINSSSWRLIVINSLSLDIGCPYNSIAINGHYWPLMHTEEVQQCLCAIVFLWYFVYCCPRPNPHLPDVATMLPDVPDASMVVIHVIYNERPTHAFPPGL